MFRQETFPIPTALGGRAAKMFQILLRGWVLNTHWVSISAISKQYSPTTGSVDAGWCEDCRDEVCVRLPVPGLGGRVPAASLSQCGNNQDLSF